MFIKGENHSGTHHLMYTSYSPLQIPAIGEWPWSPWGPGLQSKPESLHSEQNRCRPGNPNEQFSKPVWTEALLREQYGSGHRSSQRPNHPQRQLQSEAWIAPENSLRILRFSWNFPAYSIASSNVRSVMFTACGLLATTNQCRITRFYFVKTFSF